MTMRNKFTAVLSAAILVSCGALFLGQRVSAAGEGKITGTVKLDGTAPHMKIVRIEVPLRQVPQAALVPLERDQRESA